MSKEIDNTLSSNNANFDEAPCTPSNTNNINNTIPSKLKFPTPPSPLRVRREERNHSSSTVRNFSYLIENKILTIKGKVEYKSCKKKFEMVLDVRNNLSQLLNFIDKEKEEYARKGTKGLRGRQQHLITFNIKRV
ncbi:hypothetical protein ACSQ67_019545 [Phaseolus vulgaris]